MEVSAVRKQCSGNGPTQIRKTVDTERKKKVKVVIRVRPPLTQDSKTCVGTAGNKVEIFNHRNIKENLQYEFSSVYDKSSQQKQIFEECVRPLLVHAVKGENVSIFAYGPTGAGKTYTMLGTEDEPGMIPRVIHTLFHSLAVSSTVPAGPAGSTAQDKDYKVSFSFLEIYNEKVQDLLSPTETDLPIREDGNHNIFVAGLTEKVICNFDDFKNLFGPASKNRTIAATKLNDRSSRSHCIVQLKVDARRKGQVYHGKIYLIDLAGSEDNRRTGNIGIRLKESGAINKSLFVLGEVVDAINNNLPRVPYRNSKLTRLLQVFMKTHTEFTLLGAVFQGLCTAVVSIYARQITEGETQPKFFTGDSIGGSCHSVMITNVAPEETYYYDTYCTLNFATKSRKIVNSNTTSISIDRPTAKVLKRSHSDSLTKDGKRPKLSPTSSSSSHTSPASDALPLGPLVQRQDHLEKTVKGCIQRMEDLVHKIHQKSATKPCKTSAKPDPTLSEIQHQLSQVQAQLKELQQQKQTQQPSEQAQKPTEKSQEPSEKSQKQERRRSQRKAVAPYPSLNSILKDKTNTVSTSQKAAKAVSSALMTEDPSCSPLFPASSVLQRFNKGFKSTACEGTVAPKTPKKFKADAAKFSSQQSKQNEEFLHILNTAPVRSLQELHTVGAKRARLIFDWRQAHGNFASFEDLREIPGFTEKYVHTLLQRNFILAID